MTNYSNYPHDQELEYIFHNYTIPPYVKEATDIELFGDPILLPNLLYLDKNKEFPVHTKAACWMSYARLLRKYANNEISKNKAEQLKTELENFAENMGISADIEKLKKQDLKNKSEPDAKDYALDLSEIGLDADIETALTDDKSKKTDSEEQNEKTSQLTRPSNKKFPIRNIHELHKAANYISEYYYYLPYRVRRNMAENILAISEKRGWKLHHQLRDTLLKQAGYGLCTMEDVADLLYSRVVALKYSGPSNILPEVAKQMLKMAKVCYLKPDLVFDSPKLIKIAELVDLYDKTILKEKAKNLRKIEDSLFYINHVSLLKEAKSKVRTVNGTVYNLDDFSKLRIYHLQDYLPEDILNELSSDGIHVDYKKVAEILPTLPKQDATMLEQALNDLHIYPIYKEASDYEIRVNRDYLKFIGKRFSRK